MPLAVDHADFSRISSKQYVDFVSAYGFDATGIHAFRMLAEMQELRWTSYVIGKAAASPASADEASHRIACLKGEVLRPWNWQAF